MRISLPKRRPLRIAALAGIVIAFVLVTTGLLAALFPARAVASSSSLEVLDGIVALSHDGATFAEGRDGDVVQQGDVIRTGTNSHAVLTFYDGTTIELEPDTELIVNTLLASSNGDLVMTMQQNFGRSWHVVSRALTPNSKYEVRTPAATATVRGTAFLVTVDAQGKTNLQTTEGIVHAIAGGEEVQVPPGFETNVQPGGTPPDPATPAPPPPALVRIVVDATPNAAVVDSNGRTVGVLNGLPVRYVPGSTVKVIDGKLVITIPNPSLGRFDTHVQPANPNGTSVEVNIQTEVGGSVVGNVIENRTIGSNGVAKGGVVVTTAGTYIVPDDDAKTASDPRIGRVPPPPAGGLGVPFIGARTAAPTPIVTPEPSFVPRFNFDPRLAAATTPTPEPPSPTPVAKFNGGFQPFTEPSRVATSTATPAPNRNLTVFQSAPPELARLTAATPTPTPTLTTRLITPILIVAPTATPEATLLLRTIDPIRLLPPATPSPTEVIPRPLPPLITLPTDTPAPLPSGFIFRTLDPRSFGTPTPEPTLAAPPVMIVPPIRIVTPEPTLAAPPVIIVPPIRIVTPEPTPVPTPLFVPTFRIIIPTAVPTPVPTPAPTLPPIIFETLPPRIIPTAPPPPPPTKCPFRNPGLCL